MYEPRGPLPREVYVRRRVAAVVAAVVVIALVVGALYLASREGGTDTSEAASTSQEQQPAATTTSGARESTSTGPAPASRGRCGDDDLALTVWPAAANATTGSPVRFFTQIRNTSSTPCDRDLMGAPLAFEVYRLDDNTKVWSSIDCTPPQGQDKVVFAPNTPVSRQIDWSGRVTDAGSCSDAARTPAGVGSYQVYALMGKVFSPAATFNLVRG